ncbi:MAG: hypothetical protein ACXVCY_03755 [Pseudobdellovibrionaceae bacterium]
MKKVFLGTIMILSTTNAMASMAAYSCKLVGSNKEAVLYYSTDHQSITWMPARGLKTTQANAQGQVLNNGDIQFMLFGFQDQADMLILPAVAQSLPKFLNIQTYHDNDDIGEDIQKFNCIKYGN